MFDFLIETGKDLSGNLLKKDLFPTTKYCIKKNCHHVTINYPEFNAIIYGKNKDFPELVQTKEFFIGIFGYCFSRSGKNNCEIKRLQAAELLDIFKKSGKDIVKQIKGSYVIIVYDIKSNVLSVFTDELNIRTVYYAHIDDKLLLSGSLSAFVKYSKKDFSVLNTKAILEYSLFDFVLNDETFIKDVRNLSPASILTYSNYTLHITKHWDIFDAFDNAAVQLNEKDSILKLNELLKINLSAYISESDKTAFALTGGYDSRTNLALLNGKHSKGYYYSYGVEGSYDIKLAQKVAKKLKLNFNPFILDKGFAEDFPENALIAINVGDGMVEMSRANYIYAFKNMADDFDYILTGLFGSELIKRPTSLGGYIDKNIQSLLFADDFEATYETIFEKAVQNACVNKELLKIYKKEILADLKSNKYINNQYPDAQKYFFYMVGWGMRKYFMKEIKAERLFVENLHPYMDIEFIGLLLKTPFPWIYNWGKKKNLFDNLKIHKFYAHLMQLNDKRLNNIPTTHAYKPKYLLNKMYLPLLIVQYMFLRKKIKKVGIFNNNELILDFYKKKKKDIDEYKVLFNNDKLNEKFPKQIKQFNKLISLQIWLKENRLQLVD